MGRETIQPNNLIQLWQNPTPGQLAEQSMVQTLDTLLNLLNKGETIYYSVPVPGEPDNRELIAFGPEDMDDPETVENFLRIVTEENEVTFQALKSA